jgi:hypothetical protein
VTPRGSAYRSPTSLKRDQRGCRACADAGFPLPENRARVGDAVVLIRAELARL